MRVQTIEAFGDPDMFRLVTLPEPRPGSGEVVVALAATSINPVDDKGRRDSPSIAPGLTSAWPRSSSTSRTCSRSVEQPSTGALHESPSHHRQVGTARRHARRLPIARCLLFEPRSEHCVVDQRVSHRDAPIDPAIRSPGQVGPGVGHATSSGLSAGRS